tara:strand:+ start:4780 stop:6165 length:1386 start_codon:yes stop_codon:yes gene_type:complete
MTNKAHTEIAIIGAGPSGLMLALSLVTMNKSSAPLTITLFEQEDDHDLQSRANPDRSYTIDVTGHGRLAIQRIGDELLARFDKELIPFRGIQAHQLRRTLPYSEGGWTGSRGDICSALLHELKAILEANTSNTNVTFKWQSQATGIDPHSGMLTFANKTGVQESMNFDLIVAADGAGSLFRRSLEDKQLLTTTRYSIPNYSRILHLDTNDPATAFDPALLHLFSLRPWAVGGAILDAEAAHKSTDVVAESLAKDFYVQMGYSDDKPIGTMKSVRELLTNIVVRPQSGTASNPLGNYVSDDETKAYAARDVYHTGRTVECSTLVGNRCVLLGDAGTAFPPVGQGVNAALEAATVLGECLSDELKKDIPDIQTATERYNSRWLPEALACAEIANSVVYGSPLNMAKMFLLGALSDVIGVEFVGPQLAKDASYSYVDALATSRRRTRILGVISITLLALLFVAI